MPMRSLFARRSLNGLDESAARPGSADADSAAAQQLPQTQTQQQHPVFERVDTVGSKASSSRSIRSRRSQDTGEYKMSVVNDNGVYLPPSPTEGDPSSSSWSTRRRYLAAAAAVRTSTDSQRSDAAGGTGTGPTEVVEHFSITRESFDSYRRSFDISARSPVLAAATHAGTHDAFAPLPPRQSLDSAAVRHQRLSAYDHRHARRPLGQQPLSSGGGNNSTGGFEDVGLNDDAATRNQAGGRNGDAGFFNRKHGFFAKLAGSDHADDLPVTTTASNSSTAPSTTPVAAVSRFLLSGRRRAASGHGAELVSMQNHEPAAAAVSTGVPQPAEGARPS